VTSVPAQASSIAGQAGHAGAGATTGKVLVMAQIELITPSGLPQPNGYSHVARIGPGSRFVWTSGQVPIAADGTSPPATDWEAQTRQAMRNVGVALAAGGATWDDVFKLTLYVVDTSELATVRAVRDEFINLVAPPTSSLVQVAGLFRPDLLIEVEAVAAVIDR
jgi:enamine deaminase RidA (YjgF/YER057c/UK114 family)